MSSADTEMDHTERPARNKQPWNTRLVVSNLPENQDRVVGGMMSRKAQRRSVKVSRVGSKSESLEISESVGGRG